MAISPGVHPPPLLIADSAIQVPLAFSRGISFSNLSDL
jgi:hypothetical protein